MSTNLMNSTQAEMRETLKQIIIDKSFQKGEAMKLASGKSSTHYFNMKPTMLDPIGGCAHRQPYA